jgi:hypothetical protein
VRGKDEDYVLKSYCWTLAGFIGMILLEVFIGETPLAKAQGLGHTPVKWQVGSYVPVASRAEPGGAGQACL